MFLFAWIFSETTTQRKSGKWPYLYVQEFSREYIVKFLHNKTAACSAYGKNLKFYGKKLQLRKETPIYYTFQKQTLADAYKIDVFKDFAKFTEKLVYRSLCLMKLQASILQLHRKKDPGSDVFLRILWNFKEHLFFKNSFLTFQVKYIKICPDIVIRIGIKRISIEGILVTLGQNKIIVCFRLCGCKKFSSPGRPENFFFWKNVKNYLILIPFISPSSRMKSRIKLKWNIATKW